MGKLRVGIDKCRLEMINLGTISSDIQMETAQPEICSGTEVPARYHGSDS